MKALNNNSIYSVIKLWIVNKARNLRGYSKMGKEKNSVPDRWLDYSNVGRPIEGSQLIAFKTPLMEKYNIKLEELKRFTPENLVEIIPNIGLIIDLTATNRYYKPSDLIPSVKYVKLTIEGHVLPKESSVRRFQQVISDFLKDDRNASLLVGVHCTHGVNRTGYMICRYLMDCMKVPAEDAIKRFAEARGHSIERKNYMNHLRSLKSSCGNGKGEVEESSGWRRTERSYQEVSTSRSAYRAPVGKLSGRYSDRRPEKVDHRDVYNWRRPANPPESSRTLMNRDYDRRSYRQYNGGRERAFDSGRNREYNNIMDRGYDRSRDRRGSGDWGSSSSNRTWRNPNFDSRSTRLTTSRQNYNERSERSSSHRRSRFPELSRRDDYRSYRNDKK